MSTSALRWRKFVPIDRDYPIYELVDGDVVVLDVTRGEGGTYEIAFHDGASGRVFNLDKIEEVIAEAKNLLEEDRGAG